MLRRESFKAEMIRSCQAGKGESESSHIDMQRAALWRAHTGNAVVACCAGSREHTAAAER